MKSKNFSETKPHQLFKKSKAEPERLQRIEEMAEGYINRLKRFRDIHCWRKFTEMDEALGRDSGYFAGLVSGNETFPFRRFLLALDLTGNDLETFVEIDNAVPKIPRSAVGYLPLLTRKRQELTDGKIPVLLEWGRSVTISPNGHTFPVKAADIIQLSQEHPNAAQKMAEGALEALIAVKPRSLKPDSADELIRVLASYAGLLRKKGLRSDAASLFDVAFHIEDSANLPRSRAYIYRTSAFLLNDWGFLDDALIFAHRSERICLYQGDQIGLIRSLYCKGVCLDIRGEHRLAIDALEASVAFQGESDILFQFIANHSIAQCWVNLDEARRAEAVIARVPIEDLESSASAYVKAMHFALRGEVASRSGSYEKASSYFLLASEEFEEAGLDILDFLHFGLQKTRHHLRHSRPDAGLSEIKSLMPIAKDARNSNPWVEPMMLELLRSGLAGSLELTAVDHAAKKLQCATQQKWS